jgi:hypothetical protein
MDIRRLKIDEGSLNSDNLSLSPTLKNISSNSIQISPNASSRLNDKEIEKKEKKEQDKQDNQNSQEYIEEKYNNENLDKIENQTCSICSFFNRKNKNELNSIYQASHQSQILELNELCKRALKIRNDIDNEQDIDIVKTYFTNFLDLKNSYDVLLKAYSQKLDINKILPNNFPSLKDMQLLKTYALEKEIFDKILSKYKFKNIDRAYNLMERMYKSNDHSYPNRIACILKNNQHLFPENKKSSASASLSNRVMTTAHGNITDDVKYVHKILGEQKYSITDLARYFIKINELQDNQIKYFISLKINPSDIINALNLAESIIKMRRNMVFKKSNTNS